MSKYNQGKYTVINESKYAGVGTPTYRSGWELTFMQFCDNNPNIISWASEPVSINYTHPLTGQMSTYIPDFIVVYMDKNKKKHAELIEIKPANQSDPMLAKTRGQQAQTAINLAKWDAATKWAAKRGMRFRVINENDIYMNTKKPKPRKTK
jgi:hypothetical protein